MFHSTDVSNSTVIVDQPAVSPTFEPFLLYPRNAKFVAGKSRYPAIRNLGSIFLLMIFVLFFGGMTGYFIYDGYMQAQIASVGLKTTGTIIDMYTVSGKSTSYYLTYQFRAGDPPKTYQYKQSVSSATYYHHSHGQQVTVAYLAKDPNQSRLGGADKDDSNDMAAGIIMVGVSIFMLGFVGYYIREIFRDRDMAEKGHIIEGQLTAREAHMTGGKSSYYKLSVAYEFVSPTSGEQLVGKENMSRNDLRKKSLPKPGVPVAILYVDDKWFKML